MSQHMSPLKTSPFYGEDLDSKYIIPWAHSSLYPKWHLNQFSHFV